MVKKDVVDFGFGEDHFNDYLIYKRGGKCHSFLFLTNFLFSFYQRVARTSMNGLLRTCKLLLPNTITTTVEVRQHQKRPLLTQIKIKNLSIQNIINNKKNKRKH